MTSISPNKFPRSTTTTSSLSWWTLPSSPRTSGTNTLRQSKKSPRRTHRGTLQQNYCWAQSTKTNSCLANCWESRRRNTDRRFHIWSTNTHSTPTIRMRLLTKSTSRLGSDVKCLSIELPTLVQDMPKCQAYPSPVLILYNRLGVVSADTMPPVCSDLPL